MADNEKFGVPTSMVLDIQEDEKNPKKVVLKVKNGFTISASKDQFTDYEAYKLEVLALLKPTA